MRDKQNGGSASRTGRGGNASGGNAKKWIVLAIAAIVIGVVVYIIFGRTTPPPPGTETEAVSPVEASAPANVGIYIETSISNKGYANTSTESPYHKAIVELTQMYPNTGLYLGQEPYNGNRSDLIDDLSKGNIEYKSVSLLNEDIEQIARQANADSARLNLFITDAILCGPAEKVKEFKKDGKNWNELHKSDLKGQVAKALADKQNVGASVYQLVGDFNGIYYNSLNDGKPLNSERYFYIVAIGDPATLADFKNKMSNLNGSKRLTYKNVWHSIDHLPLSSDLHVTKVVPTGPIYRVASNTNYDEVDTMSTKKQIIEMSIDANVFRNHAIGERELIKMAHDADVYINDQKTELMGAGAPVYDPSRNVIKWHILKSQISKKGTNVGIEIKLPEVKWIERSTMDVSEDENIWSRGNQKDTYLLDCFIDGIRDGVGAHKGNNSELIYQREITLQLD